MLLIRKKHLCSVVALTIGGIAPYGYSQTTEGMKNIDEVVVTAQRREERILDVPISMTAVGGDKIERMGMNTTFDVLSQMPNVTSQSPEGNTGFPIFNIRGVTLLDFTDTNEPSVAIYVDDIYIGSPAVQNQQLFDVERVEVLRGPQGTLYGRNATGGLVHYITRRPTEEFEGYVKVGMGRHDEYNLEGALSGALTDNLRARLSLLEGGRDGWQVNQVNGQDFGSIDTKRAARLNMELDVTDKFMLSGNIHYNKYEGQEDLRGFYGKRDPVSGQPCSVAQVYDSLCVSNTGFRDPNPDPEKPYSDEADLPVSVENTGGWLRAEWDLGFGTLTSITSYDEAEKYHPFDVDGHTISGLTYITTSDHEQFSQELRLAGETDNLIWLVGAYYYEDERFYDNTLPYVFGGYSTWTEQDIDTSAVFGQATWSVTDTVNLTFGARYTEDTRDLISITTGVGHTPGTKLGTALFNVSDKIDNSKTTWRLAADWHFTQEHMLYASVSTGYKSGAFNTLLVPNSTAVGSADPEFTTAYEIGMKGNLADTANLTYNIALFYTDYEDIQAAATYSVIENGQTTVVTSLDTVGDAEISGLEVELSAQPIDNLYLSLGLGLIDSPTYENSDGVTVNGVAVEGNHLVMAPDSNFNGSIRYEIPMADNGLLYSILSYSWQDSAFFGPDNSPYEAQDSYGLLNINLGWVSADNKVEVSAYVKNATDEEYFIHSYDTADYFAPNWGRSRSWGGSIKYNF